MDREAPRGKSADRLSERTSENLREAPSCDLVFITSVPLGGFRRSRQRRSRRKVSFQGLLILLPLIVLPLNLSPRPARNCIQRPNRSHDFVGWSSWLKPFWSNGVALAPLALECIDMFAASRLTTLGSGWRAIVEEKAEEKEMTSMVTGVPSSLRDERQG